MIHISIDYTGIIPGLGRGPFTNIPISNTVYARLKAIGYPLKVLSSDKIIRNTVKKPAAPSEQTVVDKPATPTPEKNTVNVDSKVVVSAPVVKPAPVIVEVKQEEPTESTAGYFEVIEEHPVEAPVAEEVKSEPNVIPKKVSKEDLEGMTKEELDELLSQYTSERPYRYGKPWLIKMLKTYI